jgi:hypothetical protein
LTIRISNCSGDNGNICNLEAKTLAFITLLQAAVIVCFYGSQASVTNAPATGTRPFTPWLTKVPINGRSKAKFWLAHHAGFIDSQRNAGMHKIDSNIYIHSTTQYAPTHPACHRGAKERMLTKIDHNELQNTMVSTPRLLQSSGLTMMRPKEQNDDDEMFTMPLGGNYVQ